MSNDHSLARVSYDANEWENVKNKCLAVLPSHCDESRFWAAAISLTHTPGLKDCTPASLAIVCYSCARMGLIPDTPEQHCHVVPFKVRGKLTATVMLGFRGYCYLGYQHPAFEGFITAPVVVHANDDFDLQLGDRPRIKHRPHWLARPETLDDPGEAVAVYAVARIRGKGVPCLMNRREVEAIRAKSNAYRQGKKDSPWLSNDPYDVDQMWLKTLVKRGFNKGIWPTTTELAFATALENATDQGDPQSVVVEHYSDTPTLSDTDGLRDGFDPEAEPEYEAPTTSPERETVIDRLCGFIATVDGCGGSPPEFQYGAASEWLEEIYPARDVLSPDADIVLDRARDVEDWRARVNRQANE